MWPLFICNLSKIYCDASLSFIILSTFRQMDTSASNGFCHGDDVLRRLHANGTIQSLIVIACCVCRFTVNVIHLSYKPSTSSFMYRKPLQLPRLSQHSTLIYSFNQTYFKMSCHCYNDVCFATFANNDRVNSEIQLQQFTFNKRYINTHNSPKLNLLVKCVCNESYASSNSRNGIFKLEFSCHDVD